MPIVWDGEPRQVLAWFNDNEREWYYAADDWGQEYQGPKPQCAGCGNVGYEIRGNYVVCVGHEPDAWEQAHWETYAEDPAASLEMVRAGCKAHYRLELKDSEDVVF